MNDRIPKVGDTCIWMGSIGWLKPGDLFKIDHMIGPLGFAARRLSDDKVSDDPDEAIGPYPIHHRNFVVKSTTKAEMEI
jgi:hypothetical protein